MFKKNNEIKLLARYFPGTEYCNGGGPIKSYSLDKFPDKPAFQGVEMSRVNGARVYHQMYSKVMYNEDKAKALLLGDNEVVRVLEVII